MAAQPIDQQWDYNHANDTYTLTTRHQVTAADVVTATSGGIGTISTAPMTYAAPIANTATYVSQMNYASTEPPKPKRRKFGDGVRDAFAKLAKGGEPKPIKAPPRKRTPGGMELLPIGGAAPEAEIKTTTEHKKKITLERTVGVRRPDKEEAHRGSVELVRTMEGPEHLTENIGIAVKGNGGGHVEIPERELRKALDELSLDDPRDPGAATVR